MNHSEISTLLKEAETLAQSVSEPFRQIAFRCAVDLLQGHVVTPVAKPQPATAEKKIAKDPVNAKGPKGRIEILIANNFFAQKRALTDVLAGLAEMGFTYTSPDISAAMIRLCKGRQLRRIQDDGWKYVNS